MSSFTQNMKKKISWELKGSVVKVQNYKKINKENHAQKVDMRWPGCLVAIF